MKIVPPIKRARGYRLYDYGGRRYLDLWQNGGLAILGHRFENLTRELKSVLSRGLIFDLPSIYHRRLIRELQKRYSGFNAIYICSTFEQALLILSRFLGQSITETDICDPAKGESGPVVYDRPFLGSKTVGLKPLDSDATETESSTMRALLPIVPFRIGASPVILCLRGEAPGLGVAGRGVARAAEPASAAARRRDRDKEEVSLISPLVLAGVLRSIHSLNRFIPPPWFADPLFDESAEWIQRGPYVIPRFESELYSQVFRHFLSEGVLLSPCYEEPSILPGEASEGELKKMVRLFSENPKR